jgi:hypothetical protein
MSIDELLLQLLGNDPYRLMPSFRQWISTSRRFRAFAEQYQTKIRAKVRSAGDDEALQDLLFELEIAHWLLQEKRFQLAYERQAMRTAFGPDFTVSFTTKALFHVEVTRVRATGVDEAAAALTLSTREAYQRKLIYVITGKLNQMQVGAQNLLLIGLAPELIASSRIDELIKQMKLRIETGDPVLLAHSRLRTPGEFYRQYRALSGILFYFLAGPALAAPEMIAPLLWLNKEANYPLLTQVQTILRQLPPNK